MKVFKFFSHPYVLIICFLMIIISGEHLGGFYALYILLALPHGGVHALLAVAGIIILLFGYHKFKRRKIHRAEILLNLTGLLLLFGSLYLFFADDRSHYNWGTFEQAVPVASLFLCGAVAIVFLIDNLSIHNLSATANPG